MQFLVFNPAVERARTNADKSGRLVYGNHHDLRTAGLAPGTEVQLAADDDDALNLDGDFCALMCFQFVSTTTLTALP